MAPRFSALAIAGWLVFGTLLVVILVPAPMTDQSKPLRAGLPVEIRSAAYTVDAANSIGSERQMAVLESLVWRRGHRATQQFAISTPSVASTDLGSGQSPPVSFQGSTSRPKQALPPIPSPVSAPVRMVASAAVNVHALPGSAVKLFPLQQGDVVEVLGQTGPWSEVQGPRGPSGWVYSTYLTPAP